MVGPERALDAVEKTLMGLSLRGGEPWRAGRRRSGGKTTLRRLALALLLIAAVALAATLLNPLPKVLSGTATVVDGDTLRIASERVRLAGLDAPEIDQTCVDPNGGEWRCGLAAKRRLAALVARKELVCVPEDRDQYGRFVAPCNIDDTDIGATLVLEGLAVAEPEYAELEAEARAAKRGIWAGVFESPRAWRDRSRGSDVFAWLRGWFE
jgi:endonuclease YncB( thermonuclease family)